MIVDLYVCDEECSLRFGLIAPGRPVSLLPGQAAWRYVRNLDTRDLALPEAIEEEIDRSGYWATRNGLLRAAAGPPDESLGSPGGALAVSLSPPAGFP